MSDLHQSLAGLHDRLAATHALSAEDRALVQAVLADLQRLLDEAPARGDSGDPGAREHGDAIENAAVRLEAGHPGLAAALRSLLDALAKAGI